MSVDAVHGERGPCDNIAYGRFANTAACGWSSPTTEALSALAYAYFDTRPSALAEMNVMDSQKLAIRAAIKSVQNTQEGFFAIRSVFLLRGMLSTCGLRNVHGGGVGVHRAQRSHTQR